MHRTLKMDRPLSTSTSYPGSPKPEAQDPLSNPSDPPAPDGAYVARNGEYVRQARSAWRLWLDGLGLRSYPERNEAHHPEIGSIK